MAFVDFDLKIIPNEFVIAGLLGGVALFVYNLFYPVLIYGDTIWYNPLVGMVSGAVFFLLVAVVASIVYKNDDAIGMGDVKLFAVVRLFLGWKITIVALLLAAILAAITSLVLILLKKLKGKSTVAFGPFIALGAFIAMVYGWKIIEFYLGFMPK